MQRTLCLAGFCSALLAPSAADAAGPTWDEGGYIYVAPGSFAFELDNGDLNWQGGVGGGYMWRPDRNFYISFGGAVSHMLDGAHFNGMMLRLLPELRIGGGAGRFWAYGLFGPGLAFVFHGHGDDHAHPGFNFRTAGGVQILIWRGFYAGLEALFDFGLFSQHGNFRPVGGPRFLVGWHFG